MPFERALPCGNLPPTTPTQAMSQTIELPDPLFDEINGYANHVAASPLVIIKQAWD
jgi:hypothetical protein